MKITSLVASSALASLLLLSGGMLPASLSIAPAAEAAASISFSVFYDELAPHGDWVRLDGRHVFVPARISAGWRPYTLGHWVYADTVGWTWASDEPFGWATYHYGRWGYDDGLGWYWVPGTRWAPAWVSWRRGSDVVAWAPLPPERDGTSVSISITAGDIPDYYWVPVATRNFLDIDLRVRIIDRADERRRLLRRTDFVGVPRVRDRVVVNNVINVNVIEQEAGRKVRRVKVRNTDDATRARATDDQVTVFEGDIRAGEDAAPRRVRDAAEVRKQRRDRRDAATDREQPADDAAARSAQGADEGGSRRDQPAARNTAGEEPAAAKTEEPAAAKTAEPPARDKPVKAERKQERVKADEGRKNAAQKKAKAAESRKEKARARVKEEAATEKRNSKAKVERAEKQKTQKQRAAEQKRQNAEQKQRAAEKNKSRKDNPPARRNRVECDPQTGQNCAQ